MIDYPKIKATKKEMIKRIKEQIRMLDRIEKTDYKGGMSYGLH